MPLVRHPARWLLGTAIALAGVVVAKILGGSVALISDEQDEPTCGRN